MAIQGIKALPGQLVLKYDGSPVIAKMVVKGKAVNNSIQGSIYRRARFRPYINAQVQAAGFFFQAGLSRILIEQLTPSVPFPGFTIGPPQGTGRRQPILVGEPGSEQSHIIVNTRCKQ